MINLPKDTYIVVDPCYVLSDEIMDKICDAAEQYAYEQIIDIDGYKIAIASTTYGDGMWSSNLGINFAVDSGLIACIPIGLCTESELTDEFVQKHSLLLEATEVQFDYCGGTYAINHLEIYTNDEPGEENIEWL